MILIWRYVGRFMESRFFRTKIKRDIPSESSRDWCGGDCPWTDEVHAGTAALRHLALLLKDFQLQIRTFLSPAREERRKSSQQIQKPSPVVRPEPVWRWRDGG